MAGTPSGIGRILLIRNHTPKAAARAALVYSLHGAVPHPNFRLLRFPSWGGGGAGCCYCCSGGRAEKLRWRGGGEVHLMMIVPVAGSSTSWLLL